MKRIAVLLCAGALAACTVGPTYTAPDMHTPGTYTDVAANTPATSADVSQWWMQVNDAELQSLIARAMANNLDLLTAASRIRQARAQETIAGAAGLPSVGVSGLAAKLHSNSNPLASLGGGSSSSSSSSGAGLDTQIYSLGFDATWEIDVFGGARRGREAARAGTEAAEWQWRDGQVSLSAEVGNDYMILRAAQARLAVLRAEFDSENDLLKFAEARAQNGFVTELDVNQQRATSAATAAKIPPVEAAVRAAEHAIAVLLAEEPDTFTAELDHAQPLPAAPSQMPIGLPSDLLRRRPDVRAAERRLAAATAQEGVAVANLYPKFNLLGLASLANSNLGNLFTGDSFSGVGAGQISWPIFDAGRLKANVRIKQEDRQQAYYAYRGAVLKAVQDVEDSLARLAGEQRRARELKTAADSARASVEIAAQQYRAGLASYVNVLTTQNQFNAAEDDLIQNRQAEAQDIIALFKALGGGWNNSPPPS